MEAVGCLAAIYLMQEICCDVSGGLLTHELHYVACDPPIKKLVTKECYSYNCDTFPPIPTHWQRERTFKLTKNNSSSASQCFVCVSKKSRADSCAEYKLAFDFMKQL